MANQAFRNQLALVTGAASGIGFETAKALGKNGAQLLLVDINEGNLKKAQASLHAQGIACEYLCLDVSDETAVMRAAESIIQKADAPDILVNNAGIGYLGGFLETSSATWKKVLDVNLMGAVHMCHAFLPAMLAGRSPRHIVNVASAAGFMAVPNLSAYSASKHAVMGLSESLDMELRGSNVRVTVVCPGVINTPIVSNRQAVAATVSEAQIKTIEAHYAKHGAHPRVVGERVVEALLQGERLVMVGPTARALFNLKRVSVSLARRATLQGCRVNGYWQPQR